MGMLDQEMKKGLHKINTGMSDPDKDGYPNAIDCVNTDPNRQGPVSWLIAKAKGTTHDQVETERYSSRSTRRAAQHKERLEKIQYKAEEVKAQQPIEEHRYKQQQQSMGLAERRTALMGKKQKAMGPMPSMFGSSGGGSIHKGGSPPSLFASSVPGGQQPQSDKPKTKRKKRRKKSAKRSKGKKR